MSATRSALSCSVAYLRQDGSLLVLGLIYTLRTKRAYPSGALTLSEEFTLTKDLQSGCSGNSGPLRTLPVQQFTRDSRLHYSCKRESYSATLRGELRRDSQRRCGSRFHHLALCALFENAYAGSQKAQMYPREGQRGCIGGLKSDEQHK